MDATEQGAVWRWAAMRRPSSASDGTIMTTTYAAGRPALAMLPLADDRLAEVWVYLAFMARVRTVDGRPGLAEMAWQANVTSAHSRSPTPPVVTTPPMSASSPDTSSISWMISTSLSAA